MSKGPDGQNPWSCLDLDFVRQRRNLKQRLAMRIPLELTILTSFSRTTTTLHRRNNIVKFLRFSASLLG